MKTELRLMPHTILEGHSVVEIWYADKFIGQITGADGPGIRLISKHKIVVENEADPMIKKVVIIV